MKKRQERGRKRQRQANNKRPENKNNNFQESSFDLATPRQKSLTNIPTTFSEELLKQWNRWSTKEKIAYTTILLVGMGFTAVTIYYLLPSIVASLDATQHSTAIQERTSSKPLYSPPVQITKEVDLPRDTLRTYSDTPSPTFFAKSRSISVSWDSDLIKFTKDIENLGQNTQAIYNSVEHQIELVKKILSSRRIIHSHLMKKIIADSSFSIQITHPASLEGATARYDGETNTLYLAWQVEPDEENILNALRNDFHTVGIRTTNVERLEPKPTKLDDELISNPFLNEKGEMIEKKAEALNKAISQGDKRINHFKQLLNKFEKKIKMSSNEKITLEQYMNDITHYTPIFQEIKIEISDLPKELRSKNTKLIDENGNCRYSHSRKTDSYLPRDFYIRKISPDFNPNMIVLGGTFAKNNNPEERAKAFFADTIDGRKSRYEGTGFYAKRGLSKNDKNSEISSDIEMLDPLIRKKFYPEWCDYFTEYHGLASTDDYCSESNLSL